MRVETDVLNSLKERGVYIVKSVRLNTDQAEKSLHVAAAIIVDACFRAIETGFGWSMTLTDIRGIFDCSSNIRLTLFHLEELGLLDTTPAGRKVYYSPKMTFEKDEDIPLLISTFPNAEGKVFPYNRVMQSPRGYRTLQYTDGDISIEMDTPTLLAYDYDAFIQKRNPIVQYYNGDIEDNQLKAAWLVANNVKYLPNQFELIGPEFWERASSLYFTQTGARRPVTTPPPNWRSLPDKFWHLDTTVAERAQMYAEMTGRNLNPAPEVEVKADAPTVKMEFPPDYLDRLRKEEEQEEIEEQVAQNEVKEEPEQPTDATSEKWTAMPPEGYSPMQNTLTQVVDKIQELPCVKSTACESSIAISEEDLDHIIEICGSNMTTDTKKYCVRLILK